MVLPLLLALCTPSVHAAEPATPSVAASVQLLSRYAPGDLPPSPPVLQALAVLSERGKADVVPLLNSIVEEEQRGLALLATAALEQVDTRSHAAAKEAYRSGVPRRDRLQAWVAAANGGPLCPDGRALPRREALAVAYAALVLGEAGPEGPRMLELVDPEESQNLLLAGNAAEHRREFREAAAQYAQALGSGTDEARAHLSGLGIDPARLLLGMTADTTTGAASVLPPLAMEALVVAPGRESVTVLLDRAEAGRPLTRVVAIGALGQLAGSPHLTPREHAAVRRALTIATEAAEPFVREVALTTLTDLHEP